MRAIPFRTVGHVDASDLEHARAAFQSAFTLADVLAIFRALQPPTQPTEIVTQDEYTHDVVVAWTGAQFLVFDTT